MKKIVVTSDWHTDQITHGVRRFAEIEADPDTVHVNQRVTVAWEDHPGLSVPIFRPE